MHAWECLLCGLTTSRLIENEERPGQGGIQDSLDIKRKYPLYILFQMEEIWSVKRR